MVYHVDQRKHIDSIELNCLDKAQLKLKINKLSEGTFGILNIFESVKVAESNSPEIDPTIAQFEASSITPAVMCNNFEFELNSTQISTQKTQNSK